MFLVIYGGKTGSFLTTLTLVFGEPLKRSQSDPRVTDQSRGRGQTPNPTKVSLKTDFRTLFVRGMDGGAGTDDSAPVGVLRYLVYEGVGN